LDDINRSDLTGGLARFQALDGRETPAADGPRQTAFPFGVPDCTPDAPA
jgi:hypothetical protein